MEILDEDNVISVLAVDHIIDVLARQEYAEATWAKALFLANVHMAQKVSWRAGDGSMAQFFE